MHDYSSPSVDSPSRQLVLDLARDLERVRIHSFELKKVKAYERQSFYENLDQIDRELEASHYAALDESARRHEKVREEAEDTLKEHIRQVETERRRKEEEARREKERVEREKAEILRREREEAERKAKEVVERKALEDAERARKAEQEAKERRERERRKQKEEEEEEENRKREAERQKEQREAAQHQAQQKAVGIKGLTEQETIVHRRYLELHQHLKKFREYMRNEGKSNPSLKQSMGDMRRTITKCVGQIREGTGANKGQVQEIKTILENAATYSEQPSVDIRQFIAFPPNHIANPSSSDENRVPSLLVYCFNIFSKCLIASLITEAAVNQNHAEPVGIVAAQIFSLESFVRKGVPLSDILWAKYRAFCPALWGIYGDDRTRSGRIAVGWRRTEPNNDNTDSPLISEQEHTDRMTALGAGFSAITLRNFGKTTRQNPFPNTIFWYSMHKILSIPVRELQETHIILLTAMLRSSAERIVGFFGHVGLGLLRRVIVDVPNELVKGGGESSTSVNQLRLLKELYFRERNIIV